MAAPIQSNARMGEGESMISALSDSVYGEFQRLFQDLGLDLTGFQLPKVVVVGCESAGKSSTLESITKCPLFPRDEDICTKMPICIEMVKAPVASYTATQGDTCETIPDITAVQPVLAKMMKEQGEAIRQEPMVIRLEDPHVTTFTVVDLPGLVAVPPDMAAATAQLVDRYLADPDTLVMCVVPATIDRLRTVASISKVLDHRRQKNSILVLTKPDDVNPALRRQRILDRVAMRREVAELGFSACVAIMNRKHDAANVTLPQAQQDEAAFFESLVASAVPMVDPAGAVHEAAELYMNKLGVSALLSEMNRLYKQVIVTDWKPRAVAMLEAEIAARTAERTALGPLVTRFGDIKAAVLEQTKEVWVEKPMSSVSFEAPHIAMARPSLQPAASAVHGSRAWAQHMERQLRGVMPEVVQSYQKLLTELEEDMAAALIEDGPFKLARFEEICEDIVNRLHTETDRRMKDVFPEVLRSMYSMLHYRVLGAQGSDCDPRFTSVSATPTPRPVVIREALTEFTTAVHGYLLTGIVLPALEHATDLPADHPVHESAAVAARRLKLTDRIALLRAAEQTIASWVMQFVFGVHDELVVYIRFQQLFPRLRPRPHVDNR